MNHTPEPSAKLEAVRVKIVEANPDILNIRIRGCTFDDNDRGDRWTTCCGKCDEGYLYAYSCVGDWHDLAGFEPGDRWRWKYRRFSPEELEGVKPLGRPIRLADVLLALQGCRKEIETDVWGGIRHVYTGHQQYETLGGCEWDLLHDSLDEQSPETVAFLFDLLCP